MCKREGSRNFSGGAFSGTFSSPTCFAPPPPTSRPNSPCPALSATHNISPSQQSEESNPPWTPTLLRSFAIHLSFLSRYFAKVCPLLGRKCDVHHDAPPICIAIPFAEVLVRKGRTCATAVRRGSYKFLSLLNPGHVPRKIGIQF